MKTLPKLLLGLTAALAAPAQDIRFETGVTNIHVDAVVTQQGRSLHELKPSDFVVRDEGQARPILAFEEASVPLDLVLLVDAAVTPKIIRGNPGGATSGAPIRNRGKEKEKINPDVTTAIAQAMKQMRPRDRTAVISFAWEPRFDQALTSDPGKVAVALQRTKVYGTRYLLAIQWAIWLLEADTKAREKDSGERKRAILLVSPARPNNDWYPDEPLIQELWGTDVALHVLRVPSDLNLNIGRGDLTIGNFGPVFYRLNNPDHIAKATGGDVAIEPETGSPGQSFPDMLERIQSSYSLWYKAPEAKPGELRHVTVELSDEAKKKYPGAVIHAREGYIAR